jgi:hypothetical protein
MKKALLLAVALITAVAWAGTLPAASSEQADQITHQPLGDASVAPAVVVRGFGPTRLAGVASDVTGSRHWSANIRAVPTTLDFGATLTVLGGPETGPVKVLASMDIRELRLPATSRWASAGDATGQTRYALSFTPKLQSPTYRLEIWNRGTRVFEVAGLKTGGTVLAGNDAICDALGKEQSVAMGVCYTTWGNCSSLDDDGRFNWTINRVAPVRWVVPAVSQEVVVGDQLRIIEETPSQGHLVFKNVSIQGANLSEMVLMDEMATIAVPEAHQPGALR